MPLPRRVLLALAALKREHGILASELEVTRLEVQIPNLPQALNGLRIAHISDIHIGEGEWLPAHVEEAAAIIREEQPEIVVNTGDYLQWEPSIERVMPYVIPFVVRDPAPDVRGPVNLSIFGNHDYYADDSTVASLGQKLQEVGIRLLINETVCVERDDAGISFAGLTHRAPGFDRAVQRLLESSHPRVALIHEPDLAERLPLGAADLVLAGHTHGGQITLPGLARQIASRFAHTAYADGFYYVNGMLMYINRGLGTTGLPFRFRARPEVTLLRLVR